MKTRYQHIEGSSSSSVTEHQSLTPRQEHWREKFVAALDRADRARQGLQKPVQKLLESGISTSTLIKWAMELEYSKSWVQQVISSVLIKAGVRRSKTAGRKTPMQAIKLAEQAMAEYRDQAPKFLLAAYRYAKKHLKKEKPAQAPSKSGRVVHQQQLTAPSNRMALAA